MLLWKKPVSLKHPALCIFLVTTVWTLVTKVVFLKYMDPFASHPLQPLAFRLNFWPTSWLMARFIFTWTKGMGPLHRRFFAVRSFYIVDPDCILKKDTQRNWMPQAKATTSQNSANLSPHTPANLSTTTRLIAFFHHPPICDLSCGMGGRLLF